MPKRLLTTIIAAFGRRARAGGKLASLSSGPNPWWTVVAFIFFGLGLAMGCGAPSQQVLTAQALSHLKPSNANNQLQTQLMVQATQASLANYRDYQVGAEDQLAIMIYGQDSLNREVRVNGQGEITLPLVGTVKVAGLAPTQIETRLEELYNANYLVNPQITVQVKEYRHQRVAVTGAVARPGSYELIGPRTLLEVLSLAGGFINQGYPTGGGAQAGDVVDVIRHDNAPDLAETMQAGGAKPFAPKTKTMVIDLHRLVSGQDPELNIAIQNGDVVYVPFAGTAYVLGGVKKPGSISVKNNLTVSQAVAMAGGVDPILGTNNITIMRFSRHGKPISIKTNLSNIIARSDPDLPIKDNDVVVVNESSIKKTLYVIRTLLPIPSGGYTLGTF
jgi:polysaccharide export outer membrane protein